MNKHLEEAACEYIVENSLRRVLLRRKNKNLMSGEDASDDPPKHLLKRYSKLKHQELYADMACFDTNNFDDIVNGIFTLPVNAFD